MSTFRLVAMLSLIMLAAVMSFFVSVQPAAEQKFLTGPSSMQNPGQPQALQSGQAPAARVIIQSSA